MCQCLSKSGQWSCPCGIAWPKCEIHRKLTTTSKGAGQIRRKTKLIRHFGTNKPLPKMRIRPGERTASEQMSDRYESFVGHLSCTQRERGTQIGHSDLKRPKRSQQVVLPVAFDPRCDEGFASEVSHKRQPDTEANVYVDLEPKRASINLPLGPSWPEGRVRE